MQQHVAELLDCITCNCVCSQHKCNICIFHIYPHGQIVTFVHKSCLSATGCTSDNLVFPLLVYFLLLLSGDVELTPGPKCSFNIKLNSLNSKCFCAIVVSCIMLLMFTIDFVLTRPFNKCNVSQNEYTQHYFGYNLTHSKMETNFRDCTELKLHFLRICPNLTNMPHNVVFSVAIKRRSVFNPLTRNENYTISGRKFCRVHCWLQQRLIAISLVSFYTALNAVQSHTKYLLYLNTS